LLILTWRLMVAGLWIGLSGSRAQYITATALQVGIPVLLAIAAALSSDYIDRAIQNNPVFMQSLAIFGLGWILALLVIVKFCSAVFFWSNAPSGYRRRYLSIWGGGLAGLVTLAILASPPFDTYHYRHLFLLAAILAFPLARMGIAPSSFEKNRHR